MAVKPDLPFYNDQPVAISAIGWIAVVASVFLGFYLLAGPILVILPGVPGEYVGAILFTGIPLLTLHFVSKGHVPALFRRYGIKAFGISVGFAILTFLVSIVLAALLSLVFTFTPNPADAAVKNMDAVGIVIFLIRTLIQLLGEELVTILPLLAILWFCVQKLHLSRTAGVIIALLLTAALFGALHLPTYNWNFVQCFGIIAMARLVMTAAYLLTRNLWVSTGAHVIHDWAVFLIGVAGAHGPISAA